METNARREARSIFCLRLDLNERARLATGAAMARVSRAEFSRRAILAAADQAIEKAAAKLTADPATLQAEA